MSRTVRKFEVSSTRAALATALLAVALAPFSSYAQTEEGSQDASDASAPAAGKPAGKTKGKSVVPPLAGPTPIDAPDVKELEHVSDVDSKRRKTLPLFIGVEHIEKLPYLPPDARFTGDYKGVAQVGLDREAAMLRFQPTKKGVGTITITDSKNVKIYEFQLDVKENTLTKDAQEMRALLSDIEGITIKIVNNRVVVDGQVLTTKDYGRVLAVVAQYGEGKASSLVTISPIAQRKIAQAIANAINNPEITVTPVNDKFILEGQAADQTEKDRAEALAEVFVPDLVKEFPEKEGSVVKIRRKFVLNMIQLKAAAPPDPGKIIQLVVHYVELNKSYTKGFRFQFTPSLSDNSVITFQNDSRGPASTVSSITGTISNLLPKLNWWKTYGHARVLQSSTLAVLDRQKGDLKNVTKIPYTTLNAQGQPITNFEEAGLVTAITPSILNPRSDSIRLQMDFSMKSLLDRTTQGPIVSQSAMQTIIIVRSGQSAAVGGLISNNNSTSYNKLPPAGAQDPLLSLYASKDFQRNQSQFVVFVTPVIKASASQGSEKVKQKFRLRD